MMTRRLSDRFEEALVYASKAHGEQKRKGTEIPYVAHLLGVCSIALEYGADEDEAIAALLHDAVEDAGGQARLEDIRGRFGEKVADIVAGCTDADVIPKPPWRERKERYIEHVVNASASVQLVSAADKLHNAQAILRDLRVHGDALWSRFNGGKEGTLWYYRALVKAFRKSPLVDELDRVVTEIERIAARRDVAHRIVP
jgi:GTP pyrophosphokinase